MSKAYKRYGVNLRYDEDQLLIDYLEEHKDFTGVTPIFREALAYYIQKTEAE